MSKKALLIGINYIGTDSALAGCINDTITMRDCLVGKYKFPSSEIRVLTDVAPVKPTRANIESAFRALVSGAKAGDTLVFHYSGHGSSVADASGDETDRRDEVLVPLDYKTAGVITDDWIYNTLKPLPAGVTLWCFTDCCHSGTVIDLAFNVKSMCVPTVSPTGNVYNKARWSNNFSFSNEKVPFPLNASVFCLSGCQDSETSADVTVNGKGQGAFTNCLSQSLNANTKITLRDLLKEVNARLDLAGYKQNSQLSLSNLGGLDAEFKL